MKTFLALINSQRFFPLKSQGQSMWPILQEGDIVYFKKIPFSKIKVNDLIVFQKKNQIICHRVIYKTQKYIITKGDNSSKSDGKIYPKQILGKVYQVKRNGQIFKPETLYLIQSTHYFSEIVKIKQAFDKEKINYVFLKGLPLHLYFEGKHPQRIYADCDVLIDKKDFQKAQNILFKFGYQKADTSLSDWQKKLKDKEVENAYWKNINGFTVVFDLHLEVVFMMTQLGSLNNLYPQKIIDNLTEEFLKNKKEVKINNENFLILNTNYLILYLALHLFHHNFRGAFRYEFLNKVIKKTKNKEKFFKEILVIIKKYKLNNFSYPVFYLLKKYYQAPLPNDFVSRIKPSSFLTLKLYNFKNLNIFNDEPRLKAGINRFLNLFLLSPNPWWKKILVFFNFQVIAAFLWSVYAKIRSNVLTEKFKPKFKKIF
jgi:signal peptidase I